MKKNMLRISLIIIIALLFCMVLINTVNAADATISVSNAVKGSTYTVTVNIPSNAVGYTGIIKVTYSDGQTDSSGQLTKLTGTDLSPYTHPGNMSASFTAKASGTATVTLEKIEILDAYANNLSVEPSKTFNVSEPAQTPTPEPPATNTTNTTNNNAVVVKFTDVSETVYTTERCNIRENYSTTSNKVGTVEKGTELKRTGVGDNGWSKVEYNGKTCYVSSTYISKEKVEIEFKASNATMYAKQSCNLRASWSTSSDKVGYLDAGQEVTVIGVAENGWSKIKYNGKEVYIATRLLQSEPVEEEPEEPEAEEPETAKDTSEELAEIKEAVGVLPEVGNNVSVYVYIVFAIFATIVSVYGMYYINKK